MAHAHAVLSNELKAQREVFYKELEARSIEPLWRVLGDAAPKWPRVEGRVHKWAGRDIRSYMLRAGGLVTPQEAERRVLMLINPAFRVIGNSRVLPGLVDQYPSEGYWPLAPARGGQPT